MQIYSIFIFNQYWKNEYICIHISFNFDLRIYIQYSYWINIPKNDIRHSLLYSTLLIYNVLNYTCYHTWCGGVVWDFPIILQLQVVLLWIVATRVLTFQCLFCQPAYSNNSNVEEFLDIQIHQQNIVGIVTLSIFIGKIKNYTQIIH